MQRLALFLSLSIALGGSALGGDNWPQWRGPSLNGTSDSTGLPLQWSDSENVAWKVKLPSWSGATPAIWGDRVFVTSASERVDGDTAPVKKKMGGDRKPEGKDLLFFCLSKKDGAELWRKKIEGANYQIGKQNMSSPSPITDGKLV